MDESKGTGFLSANRKALKFLALFAVTFGVCYFVFGIAPGVRDGLIRPYTHWLAKAAAALVNIFGEGATADGTVMGSSRFSINIAMGCDGVEAACLFLAGVIAYPTSWRAKMIGLGLGVPAVMVINLGRLVMLYYAGIFFPSVVEQIHVYVAQTLVIILSTAILIYWLDRFATKPRQA